MAMTKPREQVFDLREDPDEMKNLADDPSFAGVLKKLRRAHRDWVLDVKDLGFLPEEEMWLRFGGRAYEAVRVDPGQYPLERILAAADLVGTGPPSVPKQTEMLSDPDPTVRFWAAVGLTAQGSAARPAREALRQALEDDQPSVRATAAQALCEAGECERSLQVLVEQLRSDQEYISLRAANALQHLGERARPALPEMKRFLGIPPRWNQECFFVQHHGRPRSCFRRFGTLRKEPQWSRAADLMRLPQTP
jgi:N-sulfoglucosamine sulfohydrolase